MFRSWNGRTVPLCVLLIATAALGTSLGDEPNASGGAADTRPVILLTGFEPFGENRAANSSWEGIQGLDGSEWREFRLVSRQMRVVWGSPIAQLTEWIREYRPVAIFSFGQGGRSFRVESRALNQRGDGEDNNGSKPPESLIVTDGPMEYAASFDCAGLIERLAAKGYPVMLSDDAGQYLCEECLYSLEHLRAGGRAPRSVLFCHVPKLGAEIAGKPADAATIEAFVRDVLEYWYAMRQPAEDVTKRGTKARATAYQPADPKKKEFDAVRQFVDHYFDTWSNQDMKGYGDCFAAAATIQYIDADGSISTRNKPDFLATQIEYQGKTKNPAEERPVSVDVKLEAKLARAVVYWKLTAGPRVEYGYDHFTLVKQDGRWKILNLVFYSAPAPKKAGG